MRCIPSMPSLPGLLWLGVVVHDKVLSMDQIEQFDIQIKCKKTTDGKFNSLNSNCLMI